MFSFKKSQTSVTNPPARRLVRQYSKLSFFQIFGAVVLFAGMITLIFIGIHELGQQQLSNAAEVKDKSDTSALVAIGFLMIMLGMAFLFPSMLESKQENTTSSMRVIVFMITCLFVFLCAKIGWKCNSFADFKLDSTWAYLMAAAMGSKALQSFSENRAATGTGTPPFSGPNTGPDAGIPPSMNNPAPKNPPPAITQLLKK